MPWRASSAGCRSRPAARIRRAASSLARRIFSMSMTVPAPVLPHNRFRQRWTMRKPGSASGRIISAPREFFFGWPAETTPSCQTQGGGHLFFATFAATGRGQSNTRKKPNYQQGLDLLDRGRKMGKLAEIASKRFQAFLSFLGRSKGRARLPGRSAAPSRFGGGRRAPHPDIWRLLGDRRRAPGDGAR